MKMKRKYFIIILFSLALLSACKKEEKHKIEYPSSGFYGVNILALQDSDSLNSMGYSLCAELGKKAELKIVITNLSNQVYGTIPPVSYYDQSNGWNIGDYSGDQQEFISNKSGTIDLDITFGASPGKCRIDFYENSKSVTNSKLLYW
jgi:hypothetical protein